MAGYTLMQRLNRLW